MPNVTVPRPPLPALPDPSATAHSPNSPAADDPPPTAQANNKNDSQQSEETGGKTDDQQTANNNKSDDQQTTDNSAKSGVQQMADNKSDDQPAGKTFTPGSTDDPNCVAGCYDPKVLNDMGIQPQFSDGTLAPPASNSAMGLSLGQMQSQVDQNTIKVSQQISADSGLLAPSFEGPTMLEKAAMSLPSIPQGAVDAIVGFGDAASFGTTKYIRSLDGTQNYVNTNSPQYSGGYVAGFAVGLVGTPAALGTAFNVGVREVGAANTVFHFTSAEAAASIAETGLVASKGGVYGPGIYASSINSAAYATVQGARSVETVVPIATAGQNLLATPFPFTFRIVP